MINSAYNRDKWAIVDSWAVDPILQGITGSAAANTSTNFDLVLTDDIFIKGVEFIAQGASMGDKLSLQIIDTDGVTGVPAGTVVETPISNWNVAPGNNYFSYEAVIPKKTLATFTIRVIYSNSDLLTSAAIGINFNFLKILF